MRSTQQGRHNTIVRGTFPRFAASPAHDLRRSAAFAYTCGLNYPLNKFEPINQTLANLLFIWGTP